MPESSPLEIFVRCFKKDPDPRTKQGVFHPFRTILAVVLLSCGERLGFRRET